MHSCNATFQAISIASHYNDEVKFNQRGGGWEISCSSIQVEENHSCPGDLSIFLAHFRKLLWLNHTAQTFR